MKADDFSPQDLASMREGAERVIIRGPQGYEAGVRAKGVWFVGPMGGTITIADSGEVYHYMDVGKPRAWTAEEWDQDIKRQQAGVDEFAKARSLLS